MKRLLFFLGVPLAMFSQTARQDLVQLNYAYDSYDKISYSTRYYMYSVATGQLLETYDIFYKKNHTSFLTKSKDEEVLVNPAHLIVCDNQDKEVLVRKSPSLSNHAAKQMLSDKANMPFYMDTLMSAYKSVAPLKLLQPGVRGYKFEFYQGPYSAVEVVIDVKNWLLKEIYLYPNETTEVKGKEVQVKLKVDFLNYNLKPVFTNEFMESNYVEKSDGKFKLKSTYFNYKLYDETL